MPYSNTLVAGLLFATCTVASMAEELVAPVVEVEEDVYRYEPADNGAGPMWCFGSTCLVRSQERLFASGLETLPNVKPLNNCRWLLFQRSAGGWSEVNRDSTGRTREPCPLVAFEDGRVFLSANPTLVADPQAYGGPARPEILRFDSEHPEREPAELVPQWQGTPDFTEHSYRSFAADGKSGELVLLQNIGYTHAEWAFLDRSGKWTAQGQLVWPFGEEYDKPQPIRICYLNVALKDRAVYVCGVSDIVEPYDEWREYKRQLTGREWDYDFRRLFFTWCPDIRTGKFEPWVEIASRDRTCGWISPGDLYVDSRHDVHLVWTERALDERLRPKFFPDEKQAYSLNYAVVQRGEVQHRDVLVEGGEQIGGLQPGQGRFHVTPDGSLHVFYFVQGQEEDGRSVAENRVTRRESDGRWSSHPKIDLSPPFVQFFTATPRGGSASSSTLDLLGVRSGPSQTISYARIRFATADGEHQGPR